MPRLTDLKLPLDHDEEAIFAPRGIAADELVDFTIAKRSYDARVKCLQQGLVNSGDCAWLLSPATSNHHRENES